MSSFKNLRIHDSFGYQRFWTDFKYKIKENRYFSFDYVKHNLDLLDKYNNWLEVNHNRQMDDIIPTYKRIRIAPQIRFSDYSTQPPDYLKTYDIVDLEFNITYDEKTPINLVEFCHSFLNRDRWREAEEFLLEDSAAICLYALLIIQNRWFEYENIISKCKDTHQSILYAYVETFFGNHFPEGEINTSPLFDIWHEMMLEKITPTGKR